MSIRETRKHVGCHGSSCHDEVTKIGELGRVFMRIPPSVVYLSFKNVNLMLR
jgi:hypothetical protein